MRLYLYSQSSKWSFTIPMLCKKEYVITGPTNPIPRFLMSLLIAIDTADTVGISAVVFQ